MDDIIRYAVIQLIMPPSIDILAFNCCLHTHACTHTTHTHKHTHTRTHTHTHAHTHTHSSMVSLSSVRAFFTALDLGSTSSSEKSMESSW